MSNAIPDLTRDEARPILRRSLRTHIVFVMPDHRMLSHRFKAGQANDAKTYAAWHRSCDAHFPGAVVLNELPFEDALTRCVAALQQPAPTLAARRKARAA